MRWKVAKTNKRFFVKFMDGLKEVGIGDSVFTIGPNGGGRTLTITAFGNKYLTTDNEKQYSMETGMLKTDYQVWCLWSSEEAHKQAVRLERMRSLFRKLIHTSNSTQFSLEQIQEASKILGIYDQLAEAFEKGRLL